jgi:hypothetical protein
VQAGALCCSLFVTQPSSYSSVREGHKSERQSNMTRFVLVIHTAELTLKMVISEFMKILRALLSVAYSRTELWAVTFQWQFVFVFTSLNLLFSQCMESRHGAHMEVTWKSKIVTVLPFKRKM